MICAVFVYCVCHLSKAGDQTTQDTALRTRRAGSKYNSIDHYSFSTKSCRPCQSVESIVRWEWAICCRDPICVLGIPPIDTMSMRLDVSEVQMTTVSSRLLSLLCTLPRVRVTVPMGEGGARGRGRPCPAKRGMGVGGWERVFCVLLAQQHVLQRPCSDTIQQ